MNMVTGCETVYQNNKKIKNAMLLCLRYWITHTLARGRGKPGATDKSAASYLHKAYHVSVTAYNANAGAPLLLFPTVFVAIELESFDIAGNMLSDASSYRNYYRNNEPLGYIMLLGLSFLLELRQRKVRQARKYYRMLTDYETEAGGEEARGARFLALAIYHIEMYEYDEACNYLTESYDAGCRSVFFYSALHTYYTNAVKPSGPSRLLAAYLVWGTAHSVGLKAVLDYYRAEALKLFAANPALAKRVYDVCPTEWILTEITGFYMNKEDFTAEALRYYKEAEQRQLELDGLNSFLIRASYRNEMEDVSRYAMTEFLKDGSIGEMSVDMRLYIYHVLLTNERLKQVADERAGEIVQFCMYCLENDMRGRRCNSLYKLLLERGGEYGINTKYIAKAEAVLLKDLFTFVLRTDNPAIRYVWVGEEIKKEMTLYESVGGEVRAEATDGDFEYLCISGDPRRVIEEKLSITRLVENADEKLYLHFFTKETSGFYLLAALARCCLSHEQPPPYTTDVLGRLLSCGKLSVASKMRTSAALGSLLYQSAQRERSQGVLLGRDKYDMALEYYKSVDENYLNDQYIEQMLTVFVNTEEYERAARLLFKKSHCVTERTLFFLMKQLAQHKELHQLLADAAYELLLKSWYDKTLTDIVVKNYNGSQRDWQELSRALADISVTEPGVDEIIISNSIWMHMPDTGAQRVFARMYANTPDNPLIGQFVYYMAYEMLINAFKPDYETIAVIEKIYAESGERLLAYALCSMYTEHNLTTFNSEEIMRDSVRYGEEDGIVLPSFKKMLDKRLLSPYIERNQPFIYRGMPEKNVWLYYKADDDAEYSSKKMKYLRFGIYAAAVTHFYGESISYYISEESATGSIATMESAVFNDRVNFEEKTDDLYFEINNALIYEHMFKYEQVESVITNALKETRKIKGRTL